jgi:hypothetical protein
VEQVEQVDLAAVQTTQVWLEYRLILNSYQKMHKESKRQ